MLPFVSFLRKYPEFTKDPTKKKVKESINERRNNETKDLGNIHNVELSKLKHILGS